MTSSCRSDTAGSGRDQTTEPGVFAVITGGGTAGHVLPALAIAEALVDAGHDPAELHYVGAQRGIETRLLPPTPYPHTLLDVVGLQRRLNRRTCASTPASRRSWPRRPGGRRRCCASCDRGSWCRSAATPACRPCSPPAASDVPIVVVSYDRRPGRASPLAARLRGGLAVAFPDSPLPRAVVTGAPVRRDILAVDRAVERTEARRELGLPDDRFVVAVTAARWARRRSTAPWPATSPATPTTPGWPSATSSASGSCPPCPPSATARPACLHQVVGYEDRMELLYAACDLLVGRGGASTVAEVAVTGTPAVLVPWSGAAEDHQTLQRALAHRPGRGRAARRARPRASSAPTIDRAARRRRRPRAALGERAAGRRGACTAPGPGRPDRTCRSSLDRNVTAVVPTASPAPAAPLDLSSPVRLHVVGVGGPGMSAIAIVLAEMGHTVSGSDLREQPVLDRVRAAGVDGARRPRPGGRRRLRRRHGVDGHPGAQRRAARRRASPASPRCAGPGCSPRSARRPASVAVAGTHGKTTTTSMLMLMLADGGLQPELRHRRRRHRRRHRRPVDRWRVARRRGRRERRHPPRAAADGTILTNVEVDSPRPLRDVRGDRRRLRPLPRPGRRAQGALRRRPAVCRDWPPRHGAVTYGLAEGADFRAVDLTADGGSFSLRRRAGVRRRTRGARPDRAAAARRAQRRQRPRRHRHGHRARRAVRVVRLGAGPVRRRRPPLRHPRRRRRGHVRRRLRPPARARSPPSSPPPATAATAGGGSSPCSSPTASTAWPRCRASTPTPSSTPTSSCSRTSTRRARRRSPASRASSSSNAVLDAHPTARVVWLPRRDDMVSFLAGEVGPGDVCISMGCGDIATLPDEVLARRRPT